MTLYVFNPEHDLCMAHGGPHFVPPLSAVQMATAHVDVMRYLYGDEVNVVSVAQLETQEHPLAVSPDAVVPWGWDSALCWRLQRAGLSSSLMPDEIQLQHLRKLQHRASLMALQPQTRWVHSAEAVEALFLQSSEWVMKAPWSGAGRGVHWLSQRLTPQDAQWIGRMVRSQQGVLVEPRREVQIEVAMEYYSDGMIHQTGMSLFECKRGIYQGNWLLPDDAIASRVNLVSKEFQATCEMVDRWLEVHVAPSYRGPIGVDLYADGDGHMYVGELNLRHTMGMVAHALLLRYPQWNGRFCNPMALHEVTLSLGSNMGQRALLLRDAIGLLSRRVGPVVRRSSVLETDPWGFDSDSRFLNQVVVLHTLLSPMELLHEILDIEATLGRKRDYDPMNPPETHAYQSRTIDIDILLYDEEVIDTPLLQIPHPRMHMRRFVLQPLLEIMPDRQHPALKKSFAHLLDVLNAQI